MSANNKTLELLRDLLRISDETLIQLFDEAQPLDSDTEMTIRNLWSLANKASSELIAAQKLASTVGDTSIGWCDQCEDLATLTGERSGYPADLMLDVLCKAASVIFVVREMFKVPNNLRHDVRMTITTAIWTVMGMVMQALRILEHSERISEAA